MIHHLVSSRATNALKQPCSWICIRRLSGPVNADSVDLAVIGGGIVGAASALEIKRRFPTLQIAILEKESRLGKLCCPVSDKLRLMI